MKIFIFSIKLCMRKHELWNENNLRKVNCETWNYFVSFLIVNTCNNNKPCTEKWKCILWRVNSDLWTIKWKYIFWIVNIERIVNRGCLQQTIYVFWFSLFHMYARFHFSLSIQPKFTNTVVCLSHYLCLYFYLRECCSIVTKSHSRSFVT